MITELDIYNFQSWEEGHFVFHPGVNVIVGPSDKGKTSIIRSIRWVVWNRPSGDAIRSWWGGPTSVEIVTPEGIVVRTKSKIDTYKLGIPGRKDMEFKAFGLSIPPEISQFLDIGDVNLQMQLDQPFLLSKTPGERAIYFNRIAKMDKIDIGSSNINSWIRDITSIIGSPATKDKPSTGLIKQIEDTSKALAKFEHLDIYEMDMDVLELKNSNFIYLCNRKIELKNLIDCIDEAEEKIEKESEILIMETDIDKVIANIHDVRYKRTVRKDLSMKIEAIAAIDEEIEEKKNLLSIEPKVLGLLVALHDKREKIKLFSELTALSRKIKLLDAQIDTDTEALKESEKAFNKNFPEICPLCGSRVTHIHNEKN